MIVSRHKRSLIDQNFKINNSENNSNLFLLISILYFEFEKPEIYTIKEELISKPRGLIELRVLFSLAIILNQEPLYICCFRRT